LRVVSHAYSTDEKQSQPHKLQMFTRDHEKFSWCKSKMYTHISGVDDSLWDIIEDGLTIPVDK
jgi:hypothetical protein